MNQLSVLIISYADTLFSTFSYSIKPTKSNILLLTITYFCSFNSYLNIRIPKPFKFLCFIRMFCADLTRHPSTPRFLEDLPFTMQKLVVDIGTNARSS